MPNSPQADAVRTIIKTDVDAAVVPGSIHDPDATVVAGVPLIPDRPNQVAMGDPTGAPVAIPNRDAQGRGQSWSRDLTTYPGAWDFLIEGLVSGMLTSTGAADGYTEFTYNPDGIITAVDVWLTPAKTTKVSHSTFTYAGYFIQTIVDTYYAPDGVTIDHVTTTTMTYVGDQISATTQVTV